MPLCRVAIDRRTYRQQAYAEIRQMIMAGDLRPGDKVVVRVLSELLRLSPTPIKAALAGLERDGFLIAVPHRGYFVPEVAVHDMREIYELREALDGVAALKAAGLPDPAGFVRSVLKPLYEKQRSLVRQRDPSYSEVDVEFHRAIWHASGNSRLTQVMDNLGGQVRFGSGSSSRLPGRTKDALMEHAAIMSAVAKGDRKLAEKLAREHVRRSAEAFEKSL
jgi:DNA-binding GntR family transcriptional regulator